MNEYQKIALRAYPGRHLAQDDDQHPFDKLGDTLLTFILRELDDSEDCDSMEEAARRMNVAMKELESVHNALLIADGAPFDTHEED